MAANLADKTCVPCRGGIPPLDAAAAKQLLSQAPVLGADGRRAPHRAHFPLSGFQEGARIRQQDRRTRREPRAIIPIFTSDGATRRFRLHTHKIKGLHRKRFHHGGKDRSVVRINKNERKYLRSFFVCVGRSADGLELAPASIHVGLKVCQLPLTTSQLTICRSTVTKPGAGGRGWWRRERKRRRS